MPDAIDAMVERVRVLTIQRNVAQARIRTLEASLALSESKARHLAIPGNAERAHDAAQYEANMEASASAAADDAAATDDA
jgi:hypothetical protein